MNKLEELKQEFEAATAECPEVPDFPEGRLTHDDTKDLTMPRTVYYADVYCELSEDMTDAEIESMAVDEIHVLDYSVAAGASRPTFLIRYPDGSRARSAIESFYATREAAQAEVDAVKCTLRRDKARERFMDLILETTPELLEAAAMVSRARNLIAEAVNLHIYDEDNGDKPEPDCPYMAFLQGSKELLGRLK